MNTKQNEYITKDNSSKNRVAIYCRLSKDDGTGDESASIETQKVILSDYVNNRGWTIAGIYVDDGYTGTNFNRPSFQRMIKDIEADKIDCVITKDLSRLGRNYLDCGLYLEIFFPEHNIRYIAVNDNVDTANNQSMDITPFRNILNEMYAADISTKVKSALLARFSQGNFRSTRAPFGYKKDPDNNHHLVPDPVCAPVVRHIFDLAIKGLGALKIARILQDERVLRPGAVAADDGDTHYIKFLETDNESRYGWSENTVRNICRNPVYAGHLVGYKRRQISMKCKKKVAVPQSEWKVVANTHEPIVSQEEFDLVQQLFNQRKAITTYGYENVFSGIVKCADCGYALTPQKANRKNRDDIIDCMIYLCNNYRLNGGKICSIHSIEARHLQNCVLEYIHNYGKMALNDESFISKLQKKLADADEKSRATLLTERRKLETRAEEINKLFASLYEDKVFGRITSEFYSAMNEKYSSEQYNITETLDAIETELSLKEQNDNEARQFIAIIKEYAYCDKLTFQMVRELIDTIYVGEKQMNEDGSFTQTISIRFKFVGCIDEITYHPEKMKPVILPKKCERCGKQYTPRSNIAKYCDECRQIVRDEKVKEASDRRTAKRREYKAIHGTPGYSPVECRLCHSMFKPKSGRSRYCDQCRKKYNNPAYEFKKRKSEVKVA